MISPPPPAPKERSAGVSPPHFVLAELRACLPESNDRPTRLFSGSLCEIRTSPEPSSSVLRRGLWGALGSPRTGNCFGTGPRGRGIVWAGTGANGFAAQTSSPRKAPVDYLRLGNRTQREAPAGSQPLSPPSAFLCLPGHSARPIREKKDEFAQGSSPSLQPGLCLPFVKQGTHGWVSRIWGCLEEKLACWRAPSQGATL